MQISARPEEPASSQRASRRAPPLADEYYRASLRDALERALVAQCCEPFCYLLRRGRFNEGRQRLIAAGRGRRRRYKVAQIIVGVADDECRKGSAGTDLL